MTAENNCNSQKTLVFIVAYHAEKHIESVLDRVPKQVLQSPDVHILIVDDASADQSANLAAAWCEKNRCENITVMRNPINQGYGGNQKIGYRFAIDNNFDNVILLHGDGQYAPELLPQFIDTFKQTDADVILGSRMHSLASARRGGMPLYKIVGNRILTTFQNLVTGASLTEYHTGYRAYRTSYLSQVPFEINTNDFHFDTEILLQAFNSKAKVTEIPIPTHYGEEICRVNGLRYAKDVVIATLQYRLTQVGMFCSLKYPAGNTSIYAAKDDQRFTSYAKALQIVQKCKPERLIDIGDAPTAFMERCTAAGASVNRVKLIGGSYVPQQVLREEDIFANDMVLMLDTLENFAQPEELLLTLRNTSRRPVTKRTIVLCSAPNVAFFTIRLGLLFGRFNYANRGILDVAHKRLFTKESFANILRDCGYDIERIEGIGPPFELLLPGVIGIAMSAISDLLAKVFPNLFSFQFIATCSPKPGVKQLLAQTEKFPHTTHSEREKRILDSAEPSLAAERIACVR